MSTLSLSRLHSLHSKLEVLYEGPLKTERFYSSLIFIIERVNFSIESDMLKYGDESKKMVIMCMLMRYELQLHISAVMEERHERMYIN